MNRYAALAQMAKGKAVTDGNFVYTSGAIKSLTGDNMWYIFDWKDTDIPCDFESMADWLVDNENTEFELYKEPVKGLDVYAAMRSLRRYNQVIPNYGPYCYFYTSINNPFGEKEWVVRYNTETQKCDLMTDKEFMEANKDIGFRVYEESNNNSQ